LKSHPAPQDIVGVVIKGQPLVGLIQAVKGNRATVAFSGNRRDQELPLRELVSFKGCFDPGPEPVLPSPEEVQDAAPPPKDVGAAWWLLISDEDKETSSDQYSCLAISDLAELLYDKTGLTQLAGLWRWLHGPQLWFRLRRDRSVQPRGAAEIRKQRLKSRQDALAAQDAQRQLDLLRSGQPLTEHLQSKLSAEWRTSIERLIDLACLDDRAFQAEMGLEPILKQLSIPPQRSDLRVWLLKRELLDPDQPDGLRASVWSKDFSENLLKEAERLELSSVEPAAGDENRLDLTDHSTYTIDDAGTREIDDALSLQSDQSGEWIWIHIADPARLIKQDSGLDLEARRRATTLYLADATQPMLPMSLASGSLSLRAGQRCAALSVGVSLADDGSIQDSCIQRSWVRPRYGLTYEDGDALIELAPPGDETLAQLAELLKRRQRWRLSCGAVQFDRTEGRFRRRDGHLELQTIEPSASRLMVSEAMLLMGAVVAEFGRIHDLPLPFRSQPEADLPSPEELNQIPAGPARDAAIKRCLSRGVQGTKPMAHFSLGLEAYVQATSPIRRYADLLVHRQLIAHLEGEDPMDEASVSELIQDLDHPLRQAVQISREDQRHWQHIWFAERSEQIWTMQFLRWLRPQEQLALVHVDDLAMDLVGRLEATDPSPGQPIQIKVVITNQEQDPPLLLLS